MQIIRKASNPVILTHPSPAFSGSTRDSLIFPTNIECLLRTDSVLDNEDTAVEGKKKRQTCLYILLRERKTNNEQVNYSVSGGLSAMLWRKMKG